MSSNEPDRLTVTREQVLQASTAAGIESEPAGRLWSELSKLKSADAASGGFYLGGALMFIAAIAAGAWFAQHATYASACAVSVVLALGFGFAGHRFHRQKDMRVASGLLFVLDACMMPVIVLTFLGAVDYPTSKFDTLSLAMALSTVLVSAVLTYQSRVSFVLLPALLGVGWALSTIVDMAGAQEVWFSTSEHLVMIAYGVALVVMSLGIDRKAGEDYAFWGYLVGAISIWLGLSLLDKGSAGFVLYAAGGLVSMLIGRLLSRSVFGVLGGLAVVYYFAHLGYDVFGWSLQFIVVLLVIGAAATALTAWYRRHLDEVDALVLSLLPASIKRLLPR